MSKPMIKIPGPEDKKGEHVTWRDMNPAHFSPHDNLPPPPWSKDKGEIERMRGLLAVLSGDIKRLRVDLDKLQYAQEKRVRNMFLFLWLVVALGYVWVLWGSL